MLAPIPTILLCNFSNSEQNRSHSVTASCAFGPQQQYNGNSRWKRWINKMLLDFQLVIKLVQLNRSDEPHISSQCYQTGRHPTSILLTWIPSDICKQNQISESKSDSNMAPGVQVTLASRGRCGRLDADSCLQNSQTTIWGKMWQVGRRKLLTEQLLKLKQKNYAKHDFQLT